MENVLVSSDAPARILIVDDHPNTASMLARVLARFDTPVEVITACSGEEALQLVGDGTVDVLITDFIMPGMNGLDLVEKLRRSREPGQTILITAYDSPGLALSARQMNINNYLVKPVEPDKLRVIVAGFLKEMHSKASNGGLSARQTPFKILIADDYPDNIRLLSTRLKVEGYSFVTAFDGEEALQQMRAEKPDLLLLDVNMPKKDGFEVLEEMRSDPEISHIPVIVITAARIGANDIREGLTLGADDYITKPIDWGELVARIHSKLRVKQAEDELRSRNRELGVLPEITQKLSERLDMEALARAILSRTVNALEASNGYLVIFHTDGSSTHQMFEPIDISPWHKDDLKSRIVSEGAVAEVISSRESLLIEDVHQYQEWLLVPNDTTSSALVLPLLGRRDVLGVITLSHNEPSYFNQDHLNLVQAIVSQASLAIENAQLFAHEHKRVNELVALNQLTRRIGQFTQSAELYAQLPQLVQQLLGYPIAALWLVENGHLQLSQIAGDGDTLPRAILEIAPQQAHKTCQPVQSWGPVGGLTNDATMGHQRHVQGVIAVPLTWRDEIFGVLSIHSKSQSAFQESDRVLLEMLSAHIVNVLERISLFESVDHQQKRLSAVLDGAAEAILVVDEDNCLELLNSAGRRLFTDVEARINQELPTDHGYDELIELLEETSQTSEPTQSEILWPDGRTFSVLVTPIIEGGQVTILHDVSHFKSLDQLKNEFIATASHDLKNPIFAVLGFSDLMSKAGPLNDLQKDFLKRIRNASIQMQDLVLNLLEMARMEMGDELNMEPVEINHLLESVCQEFSAQASTKSQKLKWMPANVPLVVRGDSIRLQQVARNLLGNSVKYTPDGGELTVCAERNNGRVYLVFEDNGIGIPPDALPYVFDKFYRVHSDDTKDIDGNGLGLAIVKSIVDKHNGQIDLESWPGKGSRFTVRLKLVSDEPE